MTGGSLLRQVAAALGAAGVPFMVTGSVAAAYHGSPRATLDIDLVIDATEDQLRRVVVVASLEDVILSKLECARLGGSARQLEDVASLMALRSSDLVRGYLAHWVPVLGVEDRSEAVI